MKQYELTINDKGIRFRHTNPNPMSAEQKFNIIIALIAATTFLGFIGILGAR